MHSFKKSAIFFLNHFLNVRVVYFLFIAFHKSLSVKRFLSNRTPLNEPLYNKYLFIWHYYQFDSERIIL